jgi:haloacetate dehalogenase
MPTDSINRRTAMKTLIAAAGAGVAGKAGLAAASPAGAATPCPLPDYKNNANTWVSEAVAAFFPGFSHLDIKTSGAVIRVRHGGSGPPLLLLHGNPLTHVHWKRIAARLARKYHVILPDLRGYGDSSLPPAGENNINYSFRAMAQDMVEVMEQLGYKRFFLTGHDRGGRTAHRLYLDHPNLVLKMCLMDVVPNYYVWTNTNMDWVVKTWHWAFMAQPEPFPERMISAVPAEFFLKSRMAIRGGTGTDLFHPAAMAEYIRCYTLKTIMGSCRDYRATATCDFEMDTADLDKKVEIPLIVIWGARGQPRERAREFAEVWSQFATNIVLAEGFNCGHYIAEEMPDQLYERFVLFFV